MLPVTGLVGKATLGMDTGARARLAEEGGTSAPAGSCFAEHPASRAGFNAASKAGVNFPKS